MNIRAMVAMLLLSGTLSACVSLQTNTVMPVVVRADDLAGRGYERIGTVQLSRERFGVEVLNADDYNWAHAALQAEAGKIGADAILQPELTINEHSFLFIPFTEIKARATAIRFR